MVGKSKDSVDACESNSSIFGSMWMDASYSNHFLQPNGTRIGLDLAPMDHILFATPKGFAIMKSAMLNKFIVIMDQFP